MKCKKSLAPDGHEKLDASLNVSKLQLRHNKQQARDPPSL